MMKSITKPILHFYEAFTDSFALPVMQLEEIMAEKIRALVYTKHPSHLHDVEYLDRQGVKINPEMVMTKIKSVYNQDFDINLLRERMPRKERKWITDLKMFLSTSPHHHLMRYPKKVLNIVTEAMK